MADPSAVDLGITGITDAVEIGAGGFGIVYRAVEADLGRTVAVKVLSGNLDEAARYRFERERRAMGRLSGHPNIVTIYRGGYTDAGNAFLVMEFLNRGSLAERLATQGPIGWPEAVKFTVQLSGALETSHRAGVLHRDIKPGNILLSNLGNAKLCDFGIARLQGAPETQSSVVTASLAHAPPDIVSGARPDARSDVYSLASTMFELVAATPPFVRPTDESMVPILARIAQDPVPMLPDTQLPAAVYQVVQRAMAKEPTERPATAIEFGQLLVDAQRQLGQTPTAIPIEELEPEADGGTSTPSHIPFPSTPSGPLPAPGSSSPHPQAHAEAAQSVSNTGAPGQPAAPTIITTPSSPAAEQTAISSQQVSGEHQAASWAPPTASESANVSSGDHRVAGAGAPGGPSGAISTPVAPDSGRSGWMLWAALAGIAAIVAIGAVAVVTNRGGDDIADGGDDNLPAYSDTTTGEASTDPTTGDGSDEANGGDLPAYNESPYDEAAFETITDDTGSISIDVPSEWTDRNTQLGTDGNPSLVAGLDLEGTYFDSYEGPGVQVAVASGSSRETADLDTVLELYVDPSCISEGRSDVSNPPFTGRLERFSGCGGTDTSLAHYVFVDTFLNLTAVLRVQIVSERDAAATTIISDSLQLEDNLPE